MPIVASSPGSKNRDSRAARARYSAGEEDSCSVRYARRRADRRAQFIEYRFLVVEHSLEIYGGIIALLFSVVGIWLGLKLTKTKETIVVKEVAVPMPVPSAEPFVPNAARQEALGSRRASLEILQLIAAGLSNREIAEQLFVSENTVKTHSSRCSTS